MSTIKSKKVQIGTDATASNNFTMYQPATPDGTLRIGVGNADSPTEVGQFNANGYKASTIVAVRATMSANQAISASTWTKMNMDTTNTSVTFDTNSNYDTSLYRFTPTVAGYYQVDVKFQYTTSGSGLAVVYKNGISYAWGDYPTSSFATAVSTLVYLNGSTDYIEPYAYRTTSGTLNSNASTTYFNAILIQQA